MFARLTFIKASPDNADKLKKIYNDEVVSVVRSQKGNIGCWLLEPTNIDDEYISLTEWTSSTEANAYEASGTYKMLVDKLKDYFTDRPVLRTYNIADAKIAAAAL